MPGAATRFFLIKDHGLAISLENLEALRVLSEEVMEALFNHGFTGRGGARIDHIELFGDSSKGDSKNYVMCPGGEYDRSPCGTGTSAKLACLAADGLLAKDKEWIQESITGSTFTGRFKRTKYGIILVINGLRHLSRLRKPHI